MQLGRSGELISRSSTIEVRPQIALFDHILNGPSINLDMVVFMVLFTFTEAVGQSLFLTTKIHNYQGSECIVTVYQNRPVLM